MKTLSEKQVKQENCEDFKETIDINSILNTQNPLKALADKSQLTQTSLEENPDQEGVNNIGQRQLQLRWELIDELKQQVQVSRLVEQLDKDECLMEQQLCMAMLKGFNEQMAQLNKNIGFMTAIITHMQTENEGSVQQIAEFEEQVVNLVQRQSEVIQGLQSYFLQNE